MNDVSAQETESKEAKASKEGCLEASVNDFSYASFQLRAVGKTRLAGARVFRSCELDEFSESDARFLVDNLGIRTIYDMRNEWESAICPEPSIPGVEIKSFHTSVVRRRRDVSDRLKAGVIGEYGAPEERMFHNYRLFARNPLMIGNVLSTIAEEGQNCLVHCVHGKDRTGVLCAVMLKICGVSYDDIMSDYLITNECNADRVAQEMAELGKDMTVDELAMLTSFVEARPAYLDTFFDEITLQFGNFERYFQDGLSLNMLQRDKIANLIGR